MDLQTEAQPHGRLRRVGQFGVAALLALGLATASPGLATAGQTEGKQLAKGAGVTVGRAAAGAAIGGRVGQLVTGSPAGTVVGGLLRATPTATDQQERKAQQQAIQENLRTCGRPTFCGGR